MVVNSVNLTDKSKLLTNKPFVFLVLAGAYIMFAIAAIQYWCTNYFIQALGANSKTAFIYFGIVAVTAPLIGAILSAYLTNKLGGYTAPMTTVLAFIVAALLAVSIFFIFLEDNVTYSILLNWAALFNGSLLLPIIIGVMLTKVEPEQRATANSFANFIYHLLGFFPAPVLYGLAN